MEFTLAFGPKPEFSFSFKLYFIIVLFQYTILGDREQVFPLYYKDFFEQICSDVQFISPPEEVGEFLLHLLNYICTPFGLFDYPQSLYLWAFPQFFKLFKPLG